VIGADGQVAGGVSSSVARVALPPGRYTLEAGQQRIAVELREGEDAEIRIPYAQCSR
jgi:hypothetical protein